MVVLVGSSVPILYQNLAGPLRYRLRKGKCCRCRVEPGVLPTQNKKLKTSIIDMPSVRSFRTMSFNFTIMAGDYFYVPLLLSNYGRSPFHPMAM